MQSLSVIVCTRNRPGRLTDVLADLASQCSADTEVLIVDQSSAGPAEQVEAVVSGRGMRLLRADPRGLPHARNQGVATTTGDLILFLDDDVRLAPGCLAAHRSRYADPRVGGVVGRIRERTVRPNAARTVNRIGLGGRVITNLDGPTAVRIDTLKGANMSFRRSALAEAGPFDENYLGTAILEDADLSTRVAQAGYELWYEPAAEVEHLSEPSGGVRQEDALETERWRFHNTAYFVHRHRGRAAWIPLRATFAAIAVKRAAEWKRPTVVRVLMRALEEGWRRVSSERTSPSR